MKVSDQLFPSRGEGCWPVGFSVHGGSITLNGKEYDPFQMV